MIYLHLGLARASCESEATAQRREAQGYVRCSAAKHAELWAEANMARRAELANDGERGVVECELAPIVPGSPAQELTVSGKRPPVRSSMHGWGM